MKIAGIARILGQHEVAFPTDGGLGLVTLKGDCYLVEFSCPLESSPPRGDARIIASDGIGLDLVDGRLKYKGRDVVIGQEMELDAS